MDVKYKRKSLCMKRLSLKYGWRKRRQALKKQRESENRQCLAPIVDHAYADTHDIPKAMQTPYEFINFTVSDGANSESGETNTSNSTEEERDILSEICKKYPILTEKRCTSDIINKKKEAWIKIQQEFNSLHPGMQEWEISQLQGLWARIKVKSNADINGTKFTSEETNVTVSEMREEQHGPAIETVHCNGVIVKEEPEQSIVEDEIELWESWLPAEKVRKKNEEEDIEEQFRQKLLEMAEKEHREKMEILQIKRKTAELKLRLVEKEFNDLKNSSK